MSIDPEKVGATPSTMEVREQQNTDMYREVVREQREDLRTGPVDIGDMYRMGKQQQFKRIFRLSTMIMFTSLVQSTWEIVLVAPYAGLVNGGLSGLFWGYIWTFIGFVPVIMSLAEMASMAPTSGGQYHWVSEFASPKWQQFLSYMSGWMATTSWQAGSAGGSFIIGTLIQGVVVAYLPDGYVPQRWQGTLCVFAVALIEGIVNIVVANQLPRIQKVMVFPHGLGWIAVIAVLWVLAPHADASDVFLNFTSNGGWDNIGLSVLVGQITSVYFLILSDSAAHLAEEVETASKAVPRAMISSFLLNSLVGFIVLVSFLFALPDVNEALASPTGYPFLDVIVGAAGNGAIPILLMMVLVLLTGSIDSNASTSRQTFAFARDGGLPFGRWISKVTLFHHQTIPRNAVILTCVISALLSLINIGSTVAFNAIISLQLMALMATYSISIGCVWYRRTLGGGLHLPPARWSLGRWGAYINGMAFVYTIFILFWVPWPGAANPTPDAFNWSIVMFGAVLVISLLFWFFQGRHAYKGPVVLVRPAAS